MAGGDGSGGEVKREDVFLTPADLHGERARRRRAVALRSTGVDAGGVLDASGHFRKRLARLEQPMRRFPLPFQPKSPTCRPREQQKKLRKSGLTDRILPSAQTASESHSMRLHERVAKGGAAAVNGDECRSWAGHQVMLARVPHHQTTAPGRPSRPAAPGPVTRAADPVVHPDAKTRCVKIFRIGLGSVMKLISRISPPQLGHASGNS